MQRVVIDTNVIVSSNISLGGNPSIIMELFYRNKLQLFYSFEILAEYKRVLSYTKLKFTMEIQIAIINAIMAGGTLITPPTSTIPMPDETDRIFYDTARFGNAILITGNMKHYPNEPFIVTPTEFLTNGQYLNGLDM